MKTSKILLAACAVLFAGSLAAQSIDLGRGELPVHRAEGYDDGTPAPLVVLLHGYTSSGATRTPTWVSASSPTATASCSCPGRHARVGRRPEPLLERQ